MVDTTVVLPLSTRGGAGSLLSGASSYFYHHLLRPEQPVAITTGPFGQAPIHVELPKSGFGIGSDNDENDAATDGDESLQLQRQQQNSSHLCPIQNISLAARAASKFLQEAIDKTFPEHAPFLGKYFLDACWSYHRCVRVIEAWINAGIIDGPFWVNVAIGSDSTSTASAYLRGAERFAVICFMAIIVDFMEETADYIPEVAKAIVAPCIHAENHRRHADAAVARRSLTVSSSSSSSSSEEESGLTVSSSSSSRSVQTTQQQQQQQLLPTVTNPQRKYTQCHTIVQLRESGDPGYNLSTLLPTTITPPPLSSNTIIYDRFFCIIDFVMAYQQHLQTQMEELMLDSERSTIGPFELETVKFKTVHGTNMSMLKCLPAELIRYALDSVTPVTVDQQQQQQQEGVGGREDNDSMMVSSPSASIAAGLELLTTFSRTARAVQEHIDARLEYLIRMENKTLQQQQQQQQSSSKTSTSPKGKRVYSDITVGQEGGGGGGESPAKRRKVNNTNVAKRCGCKSLPKHSPKCSLFVPPSPPPPPPPVVPDNHITETDVVMDETAAEATATTTTTTTPTSYPPIPNEFTDFGFPTEAQLDLLSPLPFETAPLLCLPSLEDVSPLSASSEMMPPPTTTTTTTTKKKRASPGSNKKQSQTTLPNEKKSKSTTTTTTTKKKANSKAKSTNGAVATVPAAKIICNLCNIHYTKSHRHGFCGFCNATCKLTSERRQVYNKFNKYANGEPFTIFLSRLGLNPNDPSVVAFFSNYERTKNKDMENCYACRRGPLCCLSCLMYGRLPLDNIFIGLMRVNKQPEAKLRIRVAYVCCRECFHNIKPKHDTYYIDDPALPDVIVARNKVCFDALPVTSVPPLPTTQ